MEIKLSQKTDLNAIMHIIHQAQAYFKEIGVDQWQNQYPNEAAILNDIALNESYLVYLEGRVAGTFVLSFRNEVTYDQIYEGEWLSTQACAVIHRIALDNQFKGKGLTTQIILEIEKKCLLKNIYSIKIDTHEDNVSMRKMLVKNGFVYCGVIFLLDGNKRVAYEKLLK